MRKSEEFVSNKKRFFDSFGPSGDDDIKTLVDSDGAEVKKEKAADHNLLFSGNVEDHFKIGMSISKKSLKLYTEFYSSDVIIASPLGLKSVISGEGYEHFNIFRFFEGNMYSFNSYIIQKNIIILPKKISSM